MEPATHPAHEQSLKIPTVGRQVHYFPSEGDPAARANGAIVLPATVIQSFGTAINIHVLTMNPDSHSLLRYSVPHASAHNPGQSYWDWPVMK